MLSEYLTCSNAMIVKVNGLTNTMNKQIFAFILLVTLAVGCSSLFTKSIDETGHANYAISGTVTNALGVVGSVNTAIKPVNPFGGLLDIGLGAISAGLAWFAAKKTREANQNNALLETVIRGVENASMDKSATVKASIADLASKNGTFANLDSKVQNLT